MERTEDQIVGKLPIVVRLGDKDYNIKPLTILPAREWRKKLNDAMAEIVGSFSAPAEKDALPAGLTSALLNFPERIVDLLFQYAPDLTQDEILANATEEQIASAFGKVMTVAYPFLMQLGTVTKAMQAQMKVR